MINFTEYSKVNESEINKINESIEELKSYHMGGWNSSVRERLKDKINEIIRVVNRIEKNK